MAMNKQTGLKSRRFGRGDPELMLDINTTPLIDVMLVLLVMLIITIPIQLHAINLEMPVAAPSNVVPPAIVQIRIDENSTVYVDAQPVTAAELEARLGALQAMNPQQEVHIRPDRRCRYAAFASVLSATRRQGLAKVAVIGHEQFVEGR